MSKIAELKGIREAMVYEVTRRCGHKEFHSAIINRAAAERLLRTPCDECGMKAFIEAQHAHRNAEWV